MFKNICLFLTLVLGYTAVNAQTISADSVYNQYLDFNLARFQGEQDKVLEIGENIIPNAGKLPPKAQVNFYFGAGKMYEDNNQPAKALIYYEKVAAAVPDYYVVHRALGYLYLDKVKKLEQKLNASTNDNKLNAELTSEYINAVKKALPHLEKTQACDPSDETLTIIKLLYKNIKDTRGLNNLDARLKLLSKHCIDILEDK